MKKENSKQAFFLPSENGRTGCPGSGELADPSYLRIDTSGDSKLNRKYKIKPEIQNEPVI